MYIYALKLEQDKYYVGKTNNPNVRVNQHDEGIGSAWTKKYKPVELLFIKESTSIFDEDKYTKELMVKYKIENVRGGSYVTEKLEPQQINLLKREIWASSNCCNRCGSNKHFINQCKRKKDVDGDVITLPSLVKSNTPVVKTCKRCHRTGHTKTECYATTKLDGTAIKNKCTRCKRTGHLKGACYAKTDINNVVLT
jgi:predicted GIY-YIG superfamily endonuclease